MAAPASLSRPDSGLVRHLRPSPNFGVRKQGKRADSIILHYTGMPAGKGLTAAERAIRWLENPASEVSAHYVVDEDGTITQMVAERHRAWHAGVSVWQGETDMNSVSIGIEIAHPGHWWDLGAIPDRDPALPKETHPGYGDYPARQIFAVIDLVADILRRRRIGRHRVLAHSDIAPLRKQDPGEKFPWDQLFDAGIGLWVAPSPHVDTPAQDSVNASEDILKFQGVISRLGYGIEATGSLDDSTRAVVRAFQRHWRPGRVDGIVDVSTVETLERLIAARDKGRQKR